MRTVRPAPSLFAALLLVATAAAGQERAAPQAACAGVARDETLRREMLLMREADQAARQRWVAEKQSEAAGRAMQALDLKHAERLRAIFKERGVPGVCLVGRDGMGALHTLLLHTPSLALQKQALPHLEAAAGRGEVPAFAAAMLTDDILEAEGKPQLYGTNFEFKDGKLVLKPVSDPEHLEERRAKVGLPPMAESVRGLEEMYRTTVASPSPTPPAGKKP